MIDYFLSQNYCKCVEITPTYCAYEWRVCIGAHFLTALDPLLGILDGKKIEKIDNPRLN